MNGEHLEDAKSFEKKNNYGIHEAQLFGVSRTCMATSLNEVPYEFLMCGSTCSNAHFAKFSAVGINGTTKVL